MAELGLTLDFYIYWINYRKCTAKKLTVHLSIYISWAVRSSPVNRDNLTIMIRNTIEELQDLTACQQGVSEILAELPKTAQCRAWAIANILGYLNRRQQLVLDKIERET
ncbi:hypothetical protein [Neptunicella sp. SCSIO 80796]|uniref:hypothetical protein n=1 Tax=Neptunicella plasticusilytica TaxID=3117012 RepID=UPI003A4D7339